MGCRGAGGGRHRITLAVAGNPNLIGWRAPIKLSFYPWGHAQGRCCVFGGGPDADLGWRNDKAIKY